MNKSMMLVGLMLGLQLSSPAQVNFGVSAGGSLYSTTVNNGNVSSPLFTGFAVGGFANLPLFKNKAFIHVNPTIGKMITRGNFSYKDESAVPAYDFCVTQLNDEYFKNNYTVLSLPLIIQLNSRFVQPLMGIEVSYKSARMHSGGMRYNHNFLSKGFTCGAAVKLNVAFALQVRYTKALQAELQRNEIKASTNTLNFAILYNFTKGNNVAR